MSQGIALFLLSTSPVCPIFCQDDFQNFVLTRIDRLEKENSRLDEENVRLAKKS